MSRNDVYLVVTDRRRGAVVYHVIYLRSADGSWDARARRRVDAQKTSLTTHHYGAALVDAHTRDVATCSEYGVRDVFLEAEPR